MVDEHDDRRSVDRIDVLFILLSTAVATTCGLILDAIFLGRSFSILAVQAGIAGLVASAFTFSAWSRAARRRSMPGVLLSAVATVVLAHLYFGLLWGYWISGSIAEWLFMPIVGILYGGLLTIPAGLFAAWLLSRATRS